MGNTPDAHETHAWVLHPDIKTDYSARAAQDALAEAVSLAHALPGLEVMGETIVRLPRAHPGKLFGKGKIAELAELFKAAEIELVLIDGHVSPVQQRNLEKDWGVKILDRTGLILEIFSDRARTREGVLQVEMAALSYQRTRLVRAWTHLERQRGGLGFVGGPGETQIESDRRAIDIQLVRLQKQLDKVVKTRELHRSARAKVPYPIVALVGYTNAGKSTLFNRMTGSDVFAADQLFATLDPTMRRLDLAELGPVIFADTVGFISHLPHRLVDAFRATLEEAASATLLLHIIDAAAEERAINIKRVDEVLKEIDAHRLPTLMVYNKIDLLDNVQPRIDRNDSGMPVAVWLSALSGEGLDLLLQAIVECLPSQIVHKHLQLQPDQGALRAALYSHKAVVAEQVNEQGAINLEIKLAESDFLRLLKSSGLKLQDLVSLSG